MGATVHQMVSCGRCRRCLTGGRVHGPYPTHFESVGGGRQRHVYGEGGASASGMSSGAAPTEAEKEEMREEARAEADAMVEAMPPDERELVDGILADQVDLRKLRRAVEGVVRERAAGRELGDDEVRRIGDEERGRVAPVVDAVREEMRAKRAALKELRKKPVEDEPEGSGVFDDPLDDPFNEDWGDGDDEETEEDLARERYEERTLRDIDRNTRSLHDIIMEQGGIKTNPALREEYRAIPNTYKRKDGLSGDEMADHLGRHHPEFGIETEGDLLDYFRDR